MISPGGRSDEKNVAPLAGAWIEIVTDCGLLSDTLMVAPLAGAWIEMSVMLRILSALVVAPLAGAWIEIRLYLGMK